MAKMSKGQYVLLAEALGDGLAEVEKMGVSMLVPAAMTLIHTVANNLEFDNPNFDKKLFIQNIKAHADLQKVIDGMEIDIQ